MGGTSGALFEIFLRAVALHLRDGQKGGDASVTSAMITEAMSCGVDAVLAAGGAKPGYRTMVDALVPAQAAALAGKSLKDVVAGARAGAESTKEMRALAGRSNYVPFEQIQGFPDPGAVAICVILEAISASCA